MINDILNSMTKVELDQTIINEDEMYKLIINQSNLETTYVLQNNEEENFDENEYYDEHNLDSMMNNLNFNDVQLNARIEFVLTKRNSRKLLHEGYSYVKDRGEFECIQWKCTYVLAVKMDENGKKNYKYCPGRVHTYNDRDLKFVTAHQIHLPDPVEKECLKVNAKMKEMAKNTNENPRSIIKKCQINLSKEAAARMKKYPTIVQFVHRARSTEATYGQNPETIAEIIVPIPLTVTYNNELFVWRDSGYLDKERIIIFTTETNIKMMCMYKS